MAKATHKLPVHLQASPTYVSISVHDVPHEIYKQLSMAESARILRTTGLHGKEVRVTENGQEILIALVEQV